MDKFSTKIYKDDLYSEDIDSIFNQKTEDFNDAVFENRDLAHDFKMYFRLIRKRIKLFIQEKKQKNFTNVIYLTLDCPPFTQNSTKEDFPIEYISQIQKQYPDKNIRILIPIVGLDETFKSSQKLIFDLNKKLRYVEKTNIDFKFFIQNRKQKAVVYKFPKLDSNIQVYGLYSPAFSFCKDTSAFTRLRFLAPYIKAARIAIKKLVKDDFSPDIVHCENIPFFLGGEFETRSPYRIKVLQTIKDFTMLDIAKTEAFWAVINLADKKAIKKLCNDKIIKNYLLQLFNLHNNKQVFNSKNCINFIFKNYYKFRRFIDKGEEIDENFIFNKLNSRTLQIFPEIAYGEELYFNTIMYSLKKADKWIVISQTYYDELFNNPDLSGKMFKYIEKYKEKSDFVLYGADMNKYPIENTRDIYQCFSLDNFREYRGKNKKTLIKELSDDRIKTNFVDPTLFKSAEVKISGYLDSFYESPLLLISSNSEIFANGVDIAFNSILKLFEYHKNIQVIINIKDGLEINLIQNWIEFLAKNRYINGRWVFIDGEINLPKFLSAADLILLPRRANLNTKDHYLAMHYGCVPVVSRSGILNDTIADVFDDINLGCGFKSKSGMLVKEDSTEIFLNPLMKALGIYQNNPSSWNLLIKNCLNKPCGWNFKILEKYNNIYEEIAN